MKRKIIGKLIEWKETGKTQSPILLYGAKQVGKTYAVKEFASLCYENLVYVNFQENKEVAGCFGGNATVEQVVKALEVLYKTIILPEKTLIFLDEIDLCESGIKLLRLFKNTPTAYHMIVASNTMEVGIFPGIQTEIVFPMDFEEFLWAKGKALLTQQVMDHYENMIPLPVEIHEECLEEYEGYLLTGGMPTVVCAHLYHKNPAKEQEYKELIVGSYISDMTDILSNLRGAKAKEAYLSIPHQLQKENRKFQYKYIKAGGRASFYADTIASLEGMGLIYKCEKLGDGNSFKLYMNDTGLLAVKLRLDATKMKTAENFSTIRAITENYVACSLRGNGYKLHYWVSDGIAQVDFFIEKDGEKIPIVLNLEESTKTKSLKVYGEKYKPPYGIQISNANFGMENGIKNIPVYAVFNL